MRWYMTLDTIAESRRELMTDAATRAEAEENIRRYAKRIEEVVEDIGCRGLDPFPYTFGTLPLVAADGTARDTDARVRTR